MKIKELIKRLEQGNQDETVLIATDEEGNGYGDISKTFGYHLCSTDEGKEENVTVLYPFTYLSPDDIIDRE